MSSSKKSVRISTRGRTRSCVVPLVRIPTSTSVRGTAVSTTRAVTSTATRATSVATTRAPTGTATRSNSVAISHAATTATAARLISLRSVHRQTSATSTGTVQRPVATTGTAENTRSSTTRRVSTRLSRSGTAAGIASIFEHPPNVTIRTRNVATLTSSPPAEIAGNMDQLLTPFNQSAQNIIMRNTPSRRPVVSCPVCFMTNLDFNLYTMSCGHIFCYNCIILATTCYICRAPVDKSSIHILYI